MVFAVVVGALVNIWIAIELGFFKGTEGENRFDTDPLVTPINEIEEDENIA